MYPLEQGSGLSTKAPPVVTRKVISITREAVSWGVGGTVPLSGIYRVIHAEHELPGEVTLRRGQQFPPCAVCSAPVTFELLREIREPLAGFDVILYELPVVGPNAKAS